MQVNRIFYQPEATLNVLKNYLAQQNRFIESQLNEIDRREKEAINEALLKQSKQPTKDNSEKIDQLKRRIDEKEKSQDDNSENHLQNILELSLLYEELMRLEGDYYSDYYSDIQGHYINIFNEERSYLNGEFSSIQNNSNLVLVYSQLEITL